MIWRKLVDIAASFETPQSLYAAVRHNEPICCRVSIQRQCHNLSSTPLALTVNMRVCARTEGLSAASWLHAGAIALVQIEELSLSPCIAAAQCRVGLVSLCAV